MPLSKFGLLTVCLCLASGAAHAQERYVPTRGFKVVDTPQGDLSIKFFTYIRYLNQERIDGSYTDAFGNTKDVKQRVDIQLNKAQVMFLGWVFDRKFRYLGYVWSSNASQGTSTAVVVAGNLQYAFNEHFTLGGGISALPGTRTTEGNFPYWLPVDNRLIGNEFFRPSYTTGIWGTGRFIEGLEYTAMLGNNLSQLGVDAGQLDNALNTLSGALVWMPTTHEFGAGFGDVENHEKLATRFGAHYTLSRESREGQPNTDAFENVQIRLSDGTVVFTPGLFGAGVRIDDVRYQLMALDAGVKKRGFSLDAEFYWRWVGDYRGPGTDGLDTIADNGFQAIASAMLMPESVQAYAGGSMIFGDYGDPTEYRIGVNYFPWKNQAVRWNMEFIQLHKSPVGAFSLPYTVGASGPIVHVNFMLYL